VRLIRNIADNFYIGYFLILWSVNGYFVGGNALKYLILSIGLLLIASNFINASIKKDNRWVEISIFSLLYFSLLVIKAGLQNQVTTSINDIIFGLIDLLLFNIGILISNNRYKMKLLLPKSIYFIVIMSVIGIAFFFVFQNSVYNSYGSADRSSVGGGEDGINVIGIAYTNALIIIILYAIFRNLPKNNKLLSYSVVLTIILSIVVIIQTQSRGALIYLVLILFLVSFANLKLSKIISFILKRSLYIFGGLILLLAIIKLNPSSQQSLDGLSKRMEDLSGSLQGTTEDRSLDEREVIYQRFYDNYTDYMFLGQKSYKPYPHNIFIEIIQRFGIVFGFPILLMIFYSIVKAFVVIFSENSDSTSILFSMIFLFCFMQSLSSMSLEMNRSLWLSMGILIGRKKNSA